MDRRVALFATTALCLGLASPTSAQTLKDQLIGTWTLVSNVEKYQDGTERSTFGPQGKGLLILDRTGWFSFQLIGGDRPKQTGRPDNPIGPAITYLAPTPLARETNPSFTRSKALQTRTLKGPNKKQLLAS